MVPRVRRMPHVYRSVMEVLPVLRAGDRKGSVIMADREKVIEGLKAMREFFGFGLPSQSPIFEAYQNILTDTIALLKEKQERIETLESLRRIEQEGR